MLIYLYIYDASATDISTLSLHDALPISRVAPDVLQQRLAAVDVPRLGRERGEDLELDVGELDRLAAHRHRSEEHTSELQSPCNLVCRLLLEKKKKKNIKQKLNQLISITV